MHQPSFPSPGAPRPSHQRLIPYSVPPYLIPPMCIWLMPDLLECYCRALLLYSQIKIPHLLVLDDMFSAWLPFRLRLPSQPVVWFWSWKRSNWTVLGYRANIPESEQFVSEPVDSCGALVRINVHDEPSEGTRCTSCYGGTPGSSLRPSTRLRTSIWYKKLLLHFILKVALVK